MPVSLIFYPIPGSTTKKGKPVALVQFVHHSSIGAGATVIMTEYKEICCCFALVFSALCFESLPPTLVVCVSRRMCVSVCQCVFVFVSAAASFSCSCCCCLASLENAMNSNNF